MIITKFKNLTKEQKMQVGIVASLAVFAYVLHRKKLDEVITLSQAAVSDTMWASYDSGIKYGFELAHGPIENLEAALEALKH